MGEILLRASRRLRQFSWVALYFPALLTFKPGFY